LTSLFERDWRCAVLGIQSQKNANARQAVAVAAFARPVLALKTLRPSPAARSFSLLVMTLESGCWPNFGQLPRATSARFSRRSCASGRGGCSPKFGQGGVQPHFDINFTYQDAGIVRDFDRLWSI
jgi:hypothetical protein